jgi:ABC-type glycerol-3-phosphate transport system substrate-binding protein
VQLEILTGGWGDFDATVAGWITTGSGPDLVYLGSEYAAQYCSQLADMDPYLADWEELSNFLPAALETVTCDGHMRGLPLLMSARPYYYRTDLFANADSGIPLTFADALTFVADNSAVTDGAVSRAGFRDVDGVYFDAQEFIAYIWSAGGELYNEDGTSAFDSEATTEAMQFMHDRYREIFPTSTTAGLPASEGAPIMSGNIVSGIFPMWNMPPVTDEAWNNIEIAPYPAGPNGEPLVQVFTDWLSVPAYVQDKQLAADFLKFITSQENAIALVDVAGFTPVRTDAWEQLRASSPVWDKILDLTVEYGRGFSDIRASAELRPLILEQMVPYLNDQQSLADTQQNLKDEYDAILEDHGFIN